jgi:hypothetical protein
MQERTLSKSISAVVAELEAMQKRLVDSEEIAKAAGVRPGSAQAKKLIERLREHGWIRALSVRGRYEFLPAESGAHPSGDRWTELRAVLHRDPNFQVQVVLQSAAFLRGLADRFPVPDQVAVGRKTVSRGLESVYKVIRTKPERVGDATIEDGIPVSIVERLPLEVVWWWPESGDLRNPDHWVGQALRKSDPQRLTELVTKEGPTMVARCGYLAERFGVSEVSDRLAGLHRRGPTWLGTRSKEARFNSRWEVYDSIGVALGR